MNAVKFLQLLPDPTLLTNLIFHCFEVFYTASIYNFLPQLSLSKMQRIAGLVAAIAVALYFMLPGAPVDPVCIVGAGPAGLAAAAKLELKGKSVVVFEKQSQVGGKCQSIYDK